MKKLYYAALTYLVLGLLAGLYYRELTKGHPDFAGFTQLSVVHTHLLALGMLFFLVLLSLEKQLALSAHKLFVPFFWVYNAGLALTVAMLTTHGTMTVLSTAEEDISPAISGMAGMGHVVLTVGLVLLFVLLKQTVLTPGAASRASRTAHERAAS